MRVVWTTGALALALFGWAGVPARAQTPPASIDWPTAGFDGGRTGDNPHETTIAKANVATLKPSWSVSVDGSAMVAQPIVAANVATATGNHDLVVVGTDHGTTAALNAATGAVVWSHNTGFTHQNCVDLPNGDFGIAAPAAYDRPSNTVYAMGGDGKLYAYVAGTGAVVPGWPVTIIANPNLEIVYGGLNVSGGNVYVATASMCDHGTYHGRVVEVSTATAKAVNWLYVDGTVVNASGTITKAGRGGGGIWGAGGVSAELDGSYVYAATGNLNGAGPETAFYGDHVLKMTPSLGVVGSASPPLGCANCDLDFGSTPVLFQPAGCLPRLVVLNKNQEVYTYRRSPFTNVALQTLPNKSYVGDLAYDATTQELVSANTDGVRAYKVNAKCGAALSWNTPEPSAPGGKVGFEVSPPAIANGIVYYGNGYGQTLFGMDVSTGAVLWQYAIGVPMFAQPTVVNGALFVSTWTGLVIAFKPAP